MAPGAEAGVAGHRGLLHGGRRIPSNGLAPDAVAGLDPKTLDGVEGHVQGERRLLAGLGDGGVDKVAELVAERVQLDEFRVRAELEEIDVVAIEGSERDAERLHAASVALFVVDEGAESEHGAVDAHACNAEEGGCARLSHEKLASERCEGQRRAVVAKTVRVLDRDRGKKLVLQLALVVDVHDVAHDGVEQALVAALVTGGHDPSTLAAEHHEACRALERRVDVRLRGCEGAVEEGLCLVCGKGPLFGNCKGAAD